ncbi:hypothetical protein HYE10_02240 [Mycoplasmopsis bovis]|nr:hypothetical protein HYE10_02240 [Mycoplasmopsis bovis]
MQNDEIKNDDILSGIDEKMVTIKYEDKVYEGRCKNCKVDKNTKKYKMMKGNLNFKNDLYKEDLIKIIK